MLDLTFVPAGVRAGREIALGLLAKPFKAWRVWLHLLTSHISCLTSQVKDSKSVQTFHNCFRGGSDIFKSRVPPRNANHQLCCTRTRATAGLRPASSAQSSKFHLPFSTHPWSSRSTYLCYTQATWYQAPQHLSPHLVSNSQSRWIEPMHLSRPMESVWLSNVHLPGAELQQAPVHFSHRLTWRLLPLQPQSSFDSPEQQP